MRDLVDLSAWVAPLLEGAGNPGSLEACNLKLETYFTNSSFSVEPGTQATGLSGESNCASSVEPVRAVVEALPPATIWATSSK